MADKLKTITASALAAKSFPPIDFLVPDYIGMGLTLLAGRPKTGKSWFVLDIALAVGGGGRALGNIEVKTGNVLYCALEDNERRLKYRMQKMIGSGVKPERLQFATECPRFDDDGVEALREWCRSVDDPRLIIIDVFVKVRSERRGNESIYDADYRAITPLKALADEFGIAIIAVHHASKREDSVDPFDMVSGSTGLTGAADSTVLLLREPQGTTLYGRGRDTPQFETAIEFSDTTGRWRVLGDASEYRRSSERQRVISGMRRIGRPGAPQEIADIIGMPGVNVRKLLTRMAVAGEVVRVGRGVYCLPDQVPDSPNAGHNGHMSQCETPNGIM